MAKKLLIGNAAVARGAWEAGVRLVSSYPGTPSTEITESMVQYEDVYVEWAPNEKVAAEVAIGAAIGGGRAVDTCKMTADKLDKPLYTFPTLSSNCAGCTTIAITYYPDGAMRDIY